MDSKILCFKLFTFSASTLFFALIHWTSCRTWKLSAFIITHIMVSVLLTNWMCGGSRGQLREQGLVLTGSPLLSLPHYYWLFSCMTASSGQAHVHARANTHTHTYTQDIHCREVGRSGAERWDPADSTRWLGCILIYVSTQQTHMHRHLHGGPLQTHSTACTALLENTTVCTSLKGAWVS